MDLEINKELDNKNLQISMQVEMMLLLELKGYFKKCLKKGDLMILMMMNFKKILKVVIKILKITTIRTSKKVIYFFLYGPIF